MCFSLFFDAIFMVPSLIFIVFSSIKVLVSAAEAAEMILRVDDIIKCAPRQRGEH